MTAKFLLPLFLLAAPAAHAIIILEIDVNNQTFSLSGSGDVVFGSGLTATYGRGVSGPGLNTGTVEFDGAPALYATNVGTLGNANETYDLQLLVSKPGSSIVFQLKFAVSDTGAQTITGTSVGASYAGLFSDSGTASTVMNALIANGSLSNFTGLSGSDATIQVSAVPEPSALAFILGSMTFGWTCLRRRARVR